MDTKTKQQFEMLLIEFPECADELSAMYNDLIYKQQKNEK